MLWRCCYWAAEQEKIIHLGVAQRLNLFFRHVYWQVVVWIKTRPTAQSVYSFVAFYGNTHKSQNYKILW
jgi:hypothetical protein